MEIFPRCLVVLTLVLDDQVPGPGVTLPAITAIPIDAEVTRDGPHSADTARLRLHGRDYPFDPRAVRQVHVTVHMENARTAYAPLAPRRETMRFCGLMDESEISHTAEGSAVTFKCRDYTALGLDRKWVSAWDPETPFSIEGSLRSVVDRIKDLVWPLTPQAVFVGEAAGAAQQSVAQRMGTQILNAEDNDSVWDVLVEICATFGLLPVFNLDQLEIRPLTFRRKVSARFVYGQNLEKLVFRRDHRGKRQQPVKVVCWNPTTGEGLEVTYPAIPEKYLQQAGAGGRPASAGEPRVTVNAEYMQHSLVAAMSREDLLALAIALYESSAPETKGELETRELLDAGGSVSLLGLSSGDPIDIRFGTEVREALESMSPAEAVAWLSDGTRANHLRPEVAAALVDMWTRVQSLPTEWHVDQATFIWEEGRGISVRVGFATYLLSS